MHTDNISNEILSGALEVSRPISITDNMSNEILSVALVVSRLLVHTRQYVKWDIVV